MSFYRVLKPTKEAIEAKLPKPHVCGHEDIKQNLMANCMVPTDIIKARKEIEFNLNFIYGDILNEVKADAIEQFEKNGEIAYCGWTYSHEYPDFTIDETKENTTSQLAILKSIVRTPDYFEEKDKFFEKLNDITEIVDCFVDNCYDIARYEIIEMFRDFDVTHKYDEDTETETEA